MMFEPSLTKGVLEVFSPVHNALSTADEQATKAIDIQHANIHSENPASIDILFIYLVWLLRCECSWLNSHFQKKITFTDSDK